MISCLIFILIVQIYLSKEPYQYYIECREKLFFLSNKGDVYKYNSSHQKLEHLTENALDITCNIDSLFIIYKNGTMFLNKGVRKDFLNISIPYKNIKRVMFHEDTILAITSQSCDYEENPKCFRKEIHISKNMGDAWFPVNEGVIDAFLLDKDKILSLVNKEDRRQFVNFLWTGYNNFKAKQTTTLEFFENHLNSTNLDNFYKVFKVDSEIFGISPDGIFHSNVTDWDKFMKVNLPIQKDFLQINSFNVIHSNSSEILLFLKYQNSFIGDLVSFDIRSKTFGRVLENILTREKSHDIVQISSLPGVFIANVKEVIKKEENLPSQLFIMDGIENFLPEKIFTMITYDFGVTWEKLFINLHLNFSKESKGIPVLKTSGYGNIICNGNEGEYLSFDSNHIGVYYSSDAGISFDKVLPRISEFALIDFGSGYLLKDYSTQSDKVFFNINGRSKGVKELKTLNVTSNELFPVERGMEVLIFYDEMKIAHVNLRDLGSYKTCTDKDYEVWTFHQKVRRIDNQRAEFIRKKANAKCYFRKELIIQNLRKQNFSLTNVIFFFLLVLVIAILLTLYRNKIISFIIKRTHVPIYSTVSSISVRSSSQSFNEDSCQSKIDINNSNIKHQ